MALNATAGATEAGGQPVHYLRTTAPLEPDILANWANRLAYSRTNPYRKPLGANKLKSGLKSFETRQCTGGPNAALNPTTPSNSDFQARATAVGTTAADLFARIQKYAFTNRTDTNSLRHPACDQQGPYSSIGVSPEMTRYLHVRHDG